MAFFRRRRNFGSIAKKDAELARIEECVFEKAITAEPKMLDGMGIGRFLIGAVGLVKAEQLPLPVVKRSATRRICA